MARVREMARGVKSTRYSRRGPRFDSYHQHGGSQPLRSLVPEDPMACADFRKHQALTWCT